MPEYSKSFGLFRMPDSSHFENYLLALRKSSIDEKTEYTDRAALQILLQAVADEGGKGVVVHHEPKRVAGKGAPDYKIMKGALILGYVENKTIGENLDKVLKSEQIAKYKSLSDNIILTDYLHFIWINEDGMQRETLCHSTDFKGPRFRLKEDRVAAVTKLLRSFFSTAPKGIGRAQQLALALATRSQLLRDYIGEELVRQEREHKEGRLYGLYQVFRDQVFHELSLKEFADAFAQMLAYGLFLARLNSGAEMVTLHNARQFVPGAFRLIRELVDFLAELEKAEYREVRWVVEEVLSIVNTLELAAIHEDLSFKSRKAISRKAISRKVRAKDAEEWRLFSRDPFIYFYEDYLAKYDAKMKKARGVYYTPPPIVNFIVRAIDDILKDTFSIKAGLGDNRRVTVLDFACGTGTFLVEVLERIFENIGHDSGKHDLIIRDHILKNIFGFEYLIAPYTIAHLKLSQYLAEEPHNYKLKDDERFQIYLTNTLEPIEPQQNYLLPALTEEVRAAQTVKEKPILVITGNPPYSAYSKNKGAWITSKIEDYKYVDGEHFNERKHWLQDDYVKFIRFAQTKMDEVPEGIVAIITNHSWIYNPTFRGMRRSLMNTFQQIHIIDLHGSSKPREIVPDGSENQNVFDIMKGVAVSLFVKKKGLEEGIWFGDVWGTRLEKYKICASSKFTDIADRPVSPSSPFYFFSPRTSPDMSGWFEHKSLEEIFVMQSTGLLSARDKLNVAFDADELLERLRRFSRLEPEAARETFNLGPDTRDWKIKVAQKDLLQANVDPKLIRRFAYRPFDERFIFYTGKSKGLIGQPANRLSDSMEESVVALGTTRRVEAGNFRHAFAFSLLADGHSVSSKETTHVFPLFLKGPFGDSVDNLRPDFKRFLKERYHRKFDPTDIFGYVYSVLYAPTYREKFDEFLADDYARIPFPERLSDFQALAKLGWHLVQIHLLREVPALGHCQYRGKGNHEVEKLRYVEAERAIYVNATQHFTPVTPDIWNFHIGGYQVIDKYLKARKGRKLTLDEVDNVTNIANVIAFTIKHMEEIDDAYRAAFAE